MWYVRIGRRREDKKTRMGVCVVVCVCVCTKQEIDVRKLLSRMEAQCEESLQIDREMLQK